MTKRSVAFALLLTAVACGEERSGPDDRVHVADTARAADSARSSEQPARSSEQPAPSASDSVRLALDGDGLRLFIVESGSARPIPFGTPTPEVMRILQIAEGRPPRQQGDNADCQVAYATWDDGLTVWFARDRFVGWSLHGEKGTLTTVSGIGIGSTRADVDSVYAARVFQSSIGVEFTAGGLAGLLDSARKDARVVNLWAGQTCIAR